MKRQSEKPSKSKDSKNLSLTAIGEPAASTSTADAVLAGPATTGVSFVQAASATAAHERGVSALATNDLVSVAKSKGKKDPFQSIPHTVGPSTELATLTSTIVTSTADLMSSVFASHETGNVQGVHAASATTPHEFRVSALANNDLATVVHPLPVSHDAVLQANSGFTESEQNDTTGHSGSGHLANALITGSTIVKCDNYNVILPANTGEGQTKIPVPQKPNSSPFFTGRKDVLDKLGEIFVHRANSKPRRFCLLWGMGGIGKTQICLKFTEEMTDNFSHMFWIDASSHESMTLSIMGISSIPAAQASGVDSSVESVLQWISYIQEEWLIIFDNADDPSPEMVAKFIPSGNRGNILITSRNRSMGRIVSFENSIEINEMEEQDAISLLLKTSCLDALPEHLQSAKEIVTELGCIPLAVDQAGAYIEAGKCDINKYLRQFSLHRQTLLSDVTFTGASGYNQTVYGAWDLSFKEIERRAGISSAERAQAAQAAILILHICAFYHHSNISKEIFRSAAEESGKCMINNDVAKKLPQAITLLDHTLLALDSDGHWDGFIFGEGISLLLSFSLMKREKSSETLSIHPLVHLWSREKMSIFEQQRMCEAGSIILSCAIPQKLTSQDYALRRLIFPHIKANELHAREIKLIKQYYDDRCTNFALVMSENGNWNEAEQMELQVVDMRKKLLGAEHPSTFTSMGNLAVTYQKQGRWNEAEQLGVQVMNMSKKFLGAEHLYTLVSMENLAATYRNQGRWNEAEQLEIQVMDMSKKLLGVEHLGTLSSMGHLAATYQNQGRWNEAEQLGVQVMDMRKKLLGVEHPDTLSSMGNLSSTYRKQGRWNEAEQLQAQVMDMRKKLFGSDHPDTLSSMGNLAATYRKQGQWNEAEKLQVQVMVMRKKLLGAEHPYTLLSMGNLAATYQNQGRWNEAEKLAVQVMDMRKKLLGAEHPDTFSSMGNLAAIYQNQGRWNEAEKLGVQVMNMRKKLLGAEHPYTLISMGHLAATYQNQGRWKQAEQLGIQVMNMRKKLLGAEHPYTLSSIANLAATYKKQGQWNEAEQLQVQVMDMRKKLLGAEHPDTLLSMGNLSATYRKQGQWKKAEQLGVQVMDMSKKLLGAEHPYTLSSMANLAATYKKQGQLTEAEQLQVQVMNMRKRLFGAEHPETLLSMGNLAATYRNQARCNEAEQLEIQVMDMSKKLLGAEHPDTLTSMGNLACTYQDQGRWDEAEQLGVQVMNMRQILLGAEHPDTIKSMGNLAVTYREQGRWNKAEHLEVQVIDMSKKLLGAEHPYTLSSINNLAATHMKQEKWNKIK